jgi:hypothetical protein
MQPAVVHVRRNAANERSLVVAVEVKELALGANEMAFALAVDAEARKMLVDLMETRDAILVAKVHGFVGRVLLSAEST